MASEIKPIGGLTRVKLSQVVPLKTPFSVYIYPTTFCNFKCNYCAHYLPLEEMKKRYDFVKENMTMDTFNNCIEQLKEFPEKIKVISLTGHGEPLINKNIPQMVKIIKDAEVSNSVEIISNGALLTKEMADGLIYAGLDVLRISLQGLSSKMYKEVCNYTLNFDDFLANLKYYFDNKKEHMKLFVKTLDITLEENEEEIFYKTFENISDRMFIEKIQPVYDGVESTEGLDTTVDRYGGVHDKRDVCPACFYVLGVFPSGDVQPCETIYRPIILGNVNEVSLYSMWNSQQLKDFWIQHLSKNRYDNPRCKVCCAPDDIARPEDVLDYDIDEILSRIK